MKPFLMEWKQIEKVIGLAKEVIDGALWLLEVWRRDVLAKNG